MKRKGWLWVLVALVLLWGAWTYLGPNEADSTVSGSLDHLEDYPNYSSEFAVALRSFREEFGDALLSPDDAERLAFDALLSSVQTVEDARRADRIAGYEDGIYAGLARQIWTEKCKEELAREPRDVSHLVDVARKRCPNSGQIVPELTALAQSCRDWRVIEDYVGCENSLHPGERCLELLSNYAAACEEELDDAETIEQLVELERTAPEEARVRAAERLTAL